MIEAKEQPYMVRIGKLATENPGAPYKWQNGLEFHDSPSGGYSRVLRTYKRLAQQFYWPSMHKAIQKYVASCTVFHRNKTQTLSLVGLLQLLPIPCQVWDDITMDFIDGLPPSNGKSTIFVVVDRLSKSAHFLAFSHPYTAKMVVKKFVEGIVKLHVNRCVEQYLRCFVSHQPRKWSSFLPWAEFWYNTTYHSSIGMTPFQALYGRSPLSIPYYQVGASSVDEVDQTMVSRNSILQQLKINLHATVNRMKQVANSKKRHMEFQVGDLVFLKLHPYRQQIVYRRAYQKLASRFYGPYQIEAKVGKVAYKLKLPEGFRLHPVFHVLMLKKKVGETIATSIYLPPIADDGEIIMEPEAILDTRWVWKGSSFIEESLVQWKRLPQEDATWENTQELRNRFINLNLEDKVPLKEQGNDKPKRSTRVPIKNPRYRD
ncbi:hypothetical protein F0562_029610 [Nyssa sinensis]|uniref:Integrase zinc-binding domain-containing protein n=1 Tax=Nyssa sinensis TaxID=561372 RepID=A0A5J5B3P0_9ASTE|nr:hypothetical protein F0562_029610 [Nyssa sinensis]